MANSPFHPIALERLRTYLNDPSSYHLTEVEIRSCNRVLLYSEHGLAIAEDDHAVANRLLESDSPA